MTKGTISSSDGAVRSTRFFPISRRKSELLCPTSVKKAGVERVSTYLRRIYLRYPSSRSKTGVEQPDEGRQKSNPTAVSSTAVNVNVAICYASTTRHGCKNRQTRNFYTRCVLMDRNPVYARAVTTSFRPPTFGLTKISFFMVEER